MNCDRCHRRAGNVQPSDGDAAMLFLAAHGETQGEDVVLCSPCTRTLEGMSRRAAGQSLGKRSAP